jgi:uncharacterized DUF497 family protein
MRVVVGTNVFVSSFFGGYPRQVIDLWKRGKLLRVISARDMNRKERGFYEENG